MPCLRDKIILAFRRRSKRNGYYLPECLSTECRWNEKKMASLLVLEMRAVAIGDYSMPSLGTMRGNVNDDEKSKDVKTELEMSPAIFDLSLFCVH